ncbi:uncharacterized protein LOC119458190 [Dermacentor silvarum]|uniref:uncharacterized protein LOC119458190 n=1 Tax=Dermacentor silvarum TaxID=543639 RepID=UPI001897569B|nr:uncharacterized protein LOC119458190 [Dermacentor silvarum]
MVERRAMISFFLVALVAQGSAAPTDECDVHSLDNCAADLFVFATRNTVPETEGDLATFCKAQLDAETCSRAYLKKCTSSIAQGVGNVFLDDIKEEIQDRCDTSSEYHKEYIKHAPCLNKVGSSFSTCIKNTIADLDVASRLPPKQRIAGACCQYNKLDECVRKAVESTCPPETLQFSEKVLKRYAGELLGAVCTGFRSGEKCKSIQYDDQPGDASLRSVLTPLIKVGAALQG